MIVEPRISVVLASCNGAAYISEQLASLLDALSDDDEIVVCDDASEDDTVSVVRSIGDPRIKVHAFGERVGYQRNFERAIRASRGRFIFFSDQDDHCLPERIPVSLNALNRAPCVCGDAELTDSEMRMLAPSYFKLRGARSFGALHLLLRPEIIGATMACRREFLIDAIPFPKDVPHDQWLSVLAASRGQLAVVAQPFIRYRRHRNTASLTGVESRRRSLSTVLLERWCLLTALLLHRARRPR